MREIRTSGLMSGDRKRDVFCTLAPVLDSTQFQILPLTTLLDLRHRLFIQFAWRVSLASRDADARLVVVSR
jgi:hypothetical protein